MSLFYQLIQISLGVRESFDVLPTLDEWTEMFDESTRQCVVGITYIGVEKIVKSCGGVNNSGMDKRLLAFWYSYAQKIQERNVELNDKSAWLQKWFSSQGIDSCILKGQGNALLYPTPLLRQSGDIDIWVWRRDCKDDGRLNRKRMIEWTLQRSEDKNLEICYHHIGLEPMDDVEVEAHFWPTFFFNLPRLRKFERWCEDNHSAMMSNWHTLPDGEKSISIPTLEFNLVFQLIHMMRHLFAEGIGLRHILDYYYALCRYNCSQTRDLVSLRSTLHEFGLEAMAGGIMWIFANVLGVSTESLLCQPNEEVGKILLSEVERGGNFGHADESSMRMLDKNKLYLFAWRTWRNIKIMKICPSEVLWGPVYRVCQWIKYR